MVLTGIWISPDEVRELPTSGAGWQRVLDAAQEPIGLPNIQDQVENTDVQTLAKALVGVRLNDADLLDEVRELVMGAVGTQSVSGTVSFANSTAIETAATFSAPGTYLIRLTADDGQLTDEDHINIRVHAAGDTFTPTGEAALDGTGQIVITGSSQSGNNDPSVYAGADQIVSINDVVTLRGTVEDDGRPSGNVTVSWEIEEARTLALGRNLVSYVIAADLVGLDPADDVIFRDWLSDVLTEEIDGRTLQTTQEDRPNNWGTVSAASRAAAALYLGDQAELDRTALVFRGYLGDRTAYAGFSYGSDLSWQADPQNPVGINPLGATKDGHDIDGAQPEEMRRGGSFQFPPLETQYPWEGLQGSVVTAEILHRAGYDAFQWQDQALLRAVQFVDRIGQLPTRDDEWIPWIVDARYGTDFAQNESADPGKNMGWASWTHFRGAPGENLPPLVDAGLDQVVTTGTTVALDGTATDDGRPDPPAQVTTEWTLHSGPASATATFADPGAQDTTVQFSGSGTYVLRLSASDGEVSATDEVTITVSDPTDTVTVSLQDGVNGYSGTRDTRLRSDQPTTNYGTSAKLELDGNPDQVSLISWDTTLIPPQATVESVSITVDVVKDSSDDFEIYEVLRPWVELEATYQLAANGQPWDAVGVAGPGDRAAEVLGSLTSATLGSVTVDLNSHGVAMVQRWVAAPAQNFGLVIQDLADGSTDDLDVRARESGSGPVLTIGYSLGDPPPPSDPPQAADDAYTLDEDTTLTVLAAEGVLSNDTDPENDPLRAALSSGPAAGTLALNEDGSFTYAPQANYHGPDSFVYTAVDDLGNRSQPATVAITINSVNDAPVAADQLVTTPLDTTVSFRLLASDADGDVLNYVIETDPAFGTISGSAPDLTFTPNADFSGNDSFTYHVNDGTASSTTATVTLSVNAPEPQYTVNHPPRLQLGDAPLAGFPGSETDQVNLLWGTMPAGSGVLDAFQVQYREAGTDTWLDAGPISTIHTGVESRIIHSAEIDGLAYNRDYEYRVQHLRASDPVATYQATFRTRLPPHDPTGFSFVAYGDSANIAGNDGFRAVQSRINQVDPDFALLLGDNIYNHGSHVQADARFDASLNPEAAEWVASHIDYLGVGNHDISTADGRPTEELFAVPIPIAGQTAPAQPPATERSEHNYSFDYGDVHFLTFDTNSEDDATRLDGLLDWAEQDLQASSATWKIVFGHHPVAGGPDKSESPADNYFQQVVPRLLAAGADLFLAGHSHTYSRTFPLLDQQNGQAIYVLDPDDDYERDAGLIQLVSGTGGKGLRSGDLSQFPFIANGFTTSTTPALEEGFLNIDVTPTQLLVSYIAASDGRVMDSFTITGGPPNRPPLVVDDSYQLDEDGVLDVSPTLGLLANDSDPEGEPLTAAPTSSPASGTLSFKSDGSFQYTPAQNFHGVDSFSYTASDGVRTSVAATVTITVEPVNDPPVAAHQSHETLTGTPLSITLTAVDVDGDPLTYTPSNPSHGTLSGTAPQLTYTPDDGFSGNDSFSFVAHDGTVDSNSATISIEVRSNAAPVADDQVLATNEDTPLAFTLTGSDADGDALSFQIQSGPAQGTLTGTAPNLTYTPAANFHGTDSLTFVVHDGLASSAPATVSISVSPVNDPPTANDIAVSTDQDTPVSIQLAGSDLEGDPLSFSVVDGPAAGVLAGTAPNLTYTPNSGFAGTDSFTYRTNDGADDSAIATVTVTVFSSAPTTVSLQDGLDGYSGTRDTRLRSDQPTENYGTSAKLELDGNPDQISLIRWDTSGIPAQSTVTAASLTFNVLKTSNDSFEVYEALQPWEELSATYLLAAAGQPWQAPGAAGSADRGSEILASLTAAASGSLTVDLNSDGVALVQKWISNPAQNLGLVIQDLADESTDDLDVSSREASGLGPMLTISYTQGPPPPPNEPPQADDDSYQTDEDVTLSILADNGLLSNDADPESDPLRTLLVGSPAAGSLTLSADGSFTYLPDPNFNGADSFTYRALDSRDNASNLATVFITVNPVNDPPAADGQSLSTPLETPLSLQLTGSDVDGDSLTYSVNTSPTHGTLSGTAPDLTYTPDDGYTGPDSFTFFAHDGNVASAIAAIDINVSSINIPPTADDQSVATDEDVPKSITLTGTDANGDALTFQLADGPANGTLGGTPPNLTYTPQANFNGSDFFRFRTGDGQAESALATVSITVNPVNDPPTAQDLGLATGLDTAVSLVLAGNDVDGDPLSYSQLTGPANGTLTGSAPNLTYTPNSGFSGTDSFTYQANDGVLSSNTATVTIAVAGLETISFQDGVSPTPGYSGTRDASVRGDKETTNYGGRNKLWLDGNPDQGAFIRWDVSSIPVGSVVQSAEITINVVKNSNDNFNLYQVLVPWIESEVTFNEATAGNAWDLPGAQGSADRGSAVLASVTSPNIGKVTIPLSSAAVQVVQAWIDQPGKNYGITVQNFEDANTDDLDFTSREGSASDRPQLTIEYARAAAPRPAFSSSQSGSKQPVSSSRIDTDGTAPVFWSDDTPTADSISERSKQPSSRGLSDEVGPVLYQPWVIRSARLPVDRPDTDSAIESMCGHDQQDLLTTDLELALQAMFEDHSLQP